ncbi:hypothetical protein AMEX_G26877 [Astyanax mexicanus]|uniref:Uncharacterized protein n=1 Tax=Astyanax mexicanus TaxID=7994 RepID=A0A8T2KPW7_ASTMX|nr:hypothetical protein AMEX_G26877 [Astyanax mexicanus]
MCSAEWRHECKKDPWENGRGRPEHSDTKSQPDPSPSAEKEPPSSLTLPPREANAQREKALPWGNTQTSSHTASTWPTEEGHGFGRL